jgi:hypothetical protein
MACQLTAGERALVGGRVFQTEDWVRAAEPRRSTARAIDDHD